ncbi:MAG: hypothetical protein DMF60_02915 [Acidobacteria bacterium]|nr:MAG: hypothetical protein DMF60_02915 [Acidobacteriota bacterium]
MTNALDRAPSANRSRSRFGIRKAITKASLAKLYEAPKKYANTISRTSPSKRLAITAKLTIPADRATLERLRGGCWFIRV